MNELFNKIKIEKKNNCWLYIGALNYKGYGIYKKKRAHRISWEIHNGLIPKDKIICHKCDVRNCINPDHLFMGTIAENQKDMKQKGRAQKGENRANHKLTWALADEIRKNYRLNSKTHGTYGLAKKYGVSQQLISDVVLKKRWIK